MNNSLSRKRPNKVLFYINSHIEAVLVSFGTIVLYVFLNYFSKGGVLGTDVFLYMNLGLNGIKDNTVLHRYFHILFEGFFLKLSSVANYWG